MTKNKILVGLPLYQGFYHYDTSCSVRNMMEETGGHGFLLKEYYARGPSLPIKRRQCLEAAWEFDAEWLLMVDSDMVIPKPNLLWLMLQRKKKIISGVYYGKQAPWVPIAARYKNPEYVPSQNETIEDWLKVEYQNLREVPKDTIMEVDAVGGGFVLIHMSCFDGMKEPYFLMTDYHGLGEDYFMCHKLRQLGHKIHLDTSIQLGHIGDKRYDWVDHEIGKIMTAQKPAQTGFEVVVP